LGKAKITYRINSKNPDNPVNPVENRMVMLDLIAFDADDTLWHNESLYRMGRARFDELLAKYELRGSIDEQLDEVQIRNLRYYGYGVMGFVLSLIEASIKLTDGRITTDDIQGLLDLSKEMIAAEVRLFDGAEKVVAKLSSSFSLMLITKGDLLHQRSKIDQSGLRKYFQHIEIVSDKTRDTYKEILDRHNVEASRFLMIGNSLRSDILPVVELGAWAVHVPYNLTWSYEEIDPAQDVRHRYVEAEHLGRIPELIEELAKRSGL
jgi:putative hydrolase of the HAD superfamily